MYSLLDSLINQDRHKAPIYLYSCHPAGEATSLLLSCRIQRIKIQDSLMGDNTQ
jgi:hypothetical protein